jgi:membrane protein implicated in regulation of membrane protease activity
MAKPSAAAMAGPLMPVAILWLAAGTVLLLLEFGGADFEGLLIGASAALLLSLLTTLVTLPTWLQLALFAALSVTGTLALRGWSARRRSRSIPAAASAAQAEVLAPFSAEGLGRVRWQGQSWAAESLEPGTPLNIGEQVTVMGRDGNRLQVLPASRE